MLKPGFFSAKRELYAAYTWEARQLNLITGQFILQYNNKIMRNKVITGRSIKFKWLFS